MKTVMLGDLLTEQQLETTKQLMDVSKHRVRLGNR